MKTSSLHGVVVVFASGGIVAALIYGAALQMAVVAAVAILVGAINRIITITRPDEDDPGALYTIWASVLVLLAALAAMSYWYVVGVVEGPADEVSLSSSFRAGAVAVGFVGAMAVGLVAGYMLIKWIWR